MIRRCFGYRRCGCRFETEVLEPGEVEEKHAQHHHGLALSLTHKAESCKV